MTAQSSESILYDYYNPESTSFGATHALHREMNLTGLASPLSSVLFVADFYADMLDIQRA